MPTKKARNQPTRKAQSAGAQAQLGLAPEVIAKRTKKHLDELERSNYAEPTTSFFGEDDDEGGKYTKGRARQIISDARVRAMDPGGNTKRKKSTMNVRTALLYRKNLATLIEESGISQLPANIPTYLTAVTPPSPIPPRLICSVCGYWGRYKCLRCVMPFCGRTCESVHAETRCERRVV